MKLKNIVIGLLLIFLSIIAIGGYYAVSWKPLLTPANPMGLYPVFHHDDDTLRVIMIGDSWAALQSEIVSDTHLAHAISERLSLPVQFQSRGRGWAKSKDIYNLMFRDVCEEPEHSTQGLVENGPDYCIVIAGINDANSNLGTTYYCSNYLMIVRHLLALGVRPVIIEVPDVDLKHVYANRTIKKKLHDIYIAFLTNSPMNDVKKYRDDWLNMLKDKGLIDSVVYISRYKWNPLGCVSTFLYRRDLIHLNSKGYHLLDSCIITEIANDYLFRKRVNN